MSDFKPLVLAINGTRRQIADTDNLLIGSGLKNAVGDLTITPASRDLVLAANKDLKLGVGDGYVDFSGGTGFFKTTTGAVTIGPGITTVSGIATFTASGTAVTVNNNAIFSGITNTDGGIQRSTSGNLLIGTGSNTNTINIGRTGQTLSAAGDVAIAGNLAVDGYTVTLNSQTVLIEDNNLYLNNNYTTVAARRGGLAVNYLPTSTTDIVAGPYVAGVIAVSNPTVTTAGSATFTTGSLIQFSDSAQNSGLYEVLSHIGTTLTIRGIGTTSTVEDFTQNQFASVASDSATITKVNVSVIRAGTSGTWETGAGSSTPLTFNLLATAASDTLQQAYIGGNTITTSGGNGSVTIAGDQSLTLAGSVNFNMTSTGSFDANSLTGAASIITAGALTMQGGTSATFGDSIGNFGWDGYGNVATSNVVEATISASFRAHLFGNQNDLRSTLDTLIDAGTEIDIGPTTATTIRLGRTAGTTIIHGAVDGSTNLGAVILDAGAASEFVTSSGALTLTSAVAATWSTLSGALNISGAAGINIKSNSGATTVLTVNSAGTAIQVQAGVIFGTFNTGNINLPQNASARFQIEGVSTTATVTAANLTTLTNGSNADSLHFHASSANTSLSNLTSTTVNAALLPAINDGYDIGSSTLRWQDGYFTNLDASGFIDVGEISAPATPPSGFGRIYSKTDDKFYFLNDLGQEFDLTGGTSTTISGTAGENLDIGDLVTFADDGYGSAKVFKADANGAGVLINTIGYAQSTVLSGASIKVMVSGEISLADTVLDSVPSTSDVGKILYLSEVAGNSTLVSPTTPGSTSQKVAIVTRGGTGAVKVAIQIGDAIVLE